LKGDGIGLESTGDILKKVKEAGWSGENLVLGCGGGLLQKHNRGMTHILSLIMSHLYSDTLKFAFKCSLAIVDGEEVYYCHV